MPHFKCVACRTRLHVSAGSDDSVGDLCPECGTLLEPVRSLTEVVGFRAITPRSGGGPLADHESIADRVGSLVARREVTRAQMRADSEHWFDDGGPAAAAVAVALLPPDTH
ncbi:MAG: hypothetical protein QOG86_1941 [Thermoleophilaceae bacterium]|nr:hypothetical protein [Thermoleophilaceae bacterium]